MTPIIAKSPEDYCAAHTTSPNPLFDELAAYTCAHCKNPQMHTGPVEGALLRMLVQLSGVRRVFEIGTYTGYAVQGCTSAAGAGMRESGQGKLPALLRGGVTAPQARRVAGCRRCAGMHKCREVQGCAGATNALWSGKVLAPKEKPDHAIVAFNTRVTHDPRVEHVLLAVRDGVMLVRKR